MDFYLGTKTITNRQKVVSRSALKNVVFKVLHKRSPGTPSNPQNNTSFNKKPSFSDFHVHLNIKTK